LSTWPKTKPNRSTQKHWFNHEPNKKQGLTKKLYQNKGLNLNKINTEKLIKHSNCEDHEEHSSRTQQTQISIQKFSCTQAQCFIWNHALIHNLEFIHFDYQRINIILLKWISVQNQNPRIKTPRNLLLMQINPRLFTSKVAQIV